jgi:hypothetical protein
MLWMVRLSVFIISVSLSGRGLMMVMGMIVGSQACASEG